MVRASPKWGPRAWTSQLRLWQWIFRFLTIYFWIKCLRNYGESRSVGEKIKGKVDVCVRFTTHIRSHRRPHFVYCLLLYMAFLLDMRFPGRQNRSWRLYWGWVILTCCSKELIYQKTRPNTRPLEEGNWQSRSNDFWSSHIRDPPVQMVLGQNRWPGGLVHTSLLRYDVWKQDHNEWLTLLAASQCHQQTCTVIHKDGACQAKARHVLDTAIECPRSITVTTPYSRLLTEGIDILLSVTWILAGWHPALILKHIG